MSETKQEKPKKKTFGDWLKSIFYAHIKDVTDETHRYQNTNLKQEIQKIGINYKWARSLQDEFAQIQYLLKKHVLSCSHNQEDKKVKTENWEKCELCGCSRSHKYDKDNFDNTYYERSNEILEIYNTSLTGSERKVLADFYNRQIGDMSDPKKWDEYNIKMKDIFNKYPIWNEWEF